MTKVQTNSQGKVYVVNGKALLSSGGGYSEFPSYQVSSGVATRRSGALTGNEFSNITSIAGYGLYYAFIERPITGILNLSSITSVQEYGLSYSFTRSNISEIDLSSLETVGTQGLSYAFDSCSQLTSINFSKLKTLGSYACVRFIYGTKVVNISFPLLDSLSNYSLQLAFGGNNLIENIYFYALKTTSFDSYTTAFVNMLTGSGTNKTHTLHFPSNLQTTISGLTGYPNFGGTSGYVTLAFDLSATS